MRSYRYEQEGLDKTAVLRECMGLWKAIEPGLWRKGENPLVLSFVGAGGKTSLIRRMAWEAMGKGMRVLVTTTTHMACPERFGALTGELSLIGELLERYGLAVAGTLAGNGKIGAISQETYNQAVSMADLVLVEADGSRRLPLKVPGKGEPVIPEKTDGILCISGLSCLGRKGQECCLRIKEAAAVLEQWERPFKGEEWIVSREDMACLMKGGYLTPLREQYPGIPVIPVWNQADTKALAEEAEEMTRYIKEPLAVITGELAQGEAAHLF